MRTRAVGTGPFRLKEWKRGSRIVLEANPGLPADRAFPRARDPAHAALERSMQGKTIPQIGVVEIAIIDEDLPRLLSFERGDLDYIVLRGEVASRLARRRQAEARATRRAASCATCFRSRFVLVLFQRRRSR